MLDFSLTNNRIKVEVKDENVTNEIKEDIKVETKLEHMEEENKNQYLSLIHI